MPDAQALALTLLEQHRRGARFAPLRVQGEPLTLPQAYRVQDRLVSELRRGHPGAMAGYKIGLTSAAMQQMCGIAHPVYGCVLAHRVWPAGHEACASRHGRLGIEFEIAVRIGRDLLLRPGDDALARAQECVDAVAAALELIDDRHADYARLDAASLVADNAWNAGVVLGPWQPLPAELGGRRGQLLLDGSPLDQGAVGSGSAHPLESVAWLARALAEQGRSLQRGMLVMTGSIVRTRFAEAGAQWRFEVDGLGAVELRVRA